MSRDYYDGTTLESTLVRPLPCEYDLFISGQPLCAGGGPLLFPRAPQILLRGFCKRRLFLGWIHRWIRRTILVCRHKIGTLLYYQVCYEENNLIQLAAFARVHYVFPLEHPPPPSGDSIVFSPGTALSTCCGSIDIS